jgi:sugar phosphate isomerase/epimerase
VNEENLPKICLGEDGFVTLAPGPKYAREEILSFARKERFRGIELHAQFEKYDQSAAAQIKEHYAKFGLEIPGIQTGHIGFCHPPISEDEDTRMEYVNGIDEALAFAEEVGANHSTLTPPLFISDMAPEYDILLKRYIDVVSRVVDRAENRDVVLAIEPEPNLFLNGGGTRESIDDVRLILDAIESKKLAILFDIAHVNIISHGDPVGFLRQLNGRVSWVHVADNDFSLSPFGTGKHQIFGEGNVDMKGLFSAMKSECPKLSWLQIDTWEHPTPFEAAAKNKKELERILSEINWTS